MRTLLALLALVSLAGCAASAHVSAKDGCFRTSSQVCIDEKK